MPKPYGLETIIFQVEDNWLDVLGAMNRLLEAGRENDPDFPLHTGDLGT